MKVYTGGTFDLFHAGHVNFLRQSSHFGRVVVSLNTDEFIVSYKGKPPTLTYEERADVLLGCKYVEDVVPNSGGHDSKPAILSVGPDLISIGSDWATRDYYSQMGFDQAWLDRQGIMLLYIPYTEGISTTETKKRILGIKNF